MFINQTVYWALAQSCNVRNGKSWQNPSIAKNQTTILNEISEACKKGSFIEDCIIETWSNVADNSNNCFKVPFKIRDMQNELSSLGGIGYLKKMCSLCKANCFSENLAGCNGSISYDENLETVLQTFSKKNLADVKKNFFLTVPVFYGIWIQSPLNDVQSKILLRVFRNIHTKEVSQFTKALQISLDLALPLHVELIPQKHIDSFGVETFVPHCPRCKATAEQNENICVCNVCSHSYKVTTANKGSLFSNLSGKDFELSKEKENKIIHNVLLNQGANEKQIVEVLDNIKNKKFSCQIEKIRTQQKEIYELFPSKKISSTFFLGKLPIEMIFVPDTHTNGKQNTIITPFYLSKYPITKQLWNVVVVGDFYCKEPSTIKETNWLQAQKFCLQLSTTIKAFVRLPTEKEWEYVWRQQNLNTQKKEQGYNETRTTPVHKFPANNLGLCGMNMPVREWCDNFWLFSEELRHEKFWLENKERGDFHIVKEGATCTSIKIEANVGENELENIPKELEDPILYVLNSTPVIGFRIAISAT